MTRKKDIDGESQDFRSNLEPADEGAEIRAEASGSVPEETEEPEQGVQEQESELEQARTRAAELEDRLLRAAADFDNYKKRQARLYDETIKGASDRVLTDLLEIVDNFRRALDTAGANGNVDAFRKGTAMIYDQMNGLLGKYDVTPIEAVGQPFNPNLHEAVMRVESEEYREGTVALEMSRGYRRGDRVLRHAKVGVSTGQRQSPGESE